MFAINRTTKKRYYDDPNLHECAAQVVRVEGDRIELDQTIAYPEGGGQDSDQGIITLTSGAAIQFIHARKIYGSRAAIPDFPDIQVGGVIEHVVHPDCWAALDGLQPGATVKIRIDSIRRAQLSLSHTASHLLYLAVGRVRPDAIDKTLSCHIRTDAARFDFGVVERFSLDEISEIERLSNEMMARGSRVSVYPHADYSDARYWECEGNVIPCGGTHIEETACIGPMRVSRKSMGRNKDRLSVTFDN